MGKVKEIKNNVIGTTFLKRTTFKNFQGDLKKENPELIEKLKESIMKGFDAPIYIWHNHNNLILDGHQRIKALNELASEGFMLPADNIPVVEIVADTEKEAKRKVLEYNSKYSIINFEIMGEWASGIDMSGIAIPELKGLNMDEMETGDEVDLPDGEKGDIETMTFTVHKEQAKQIRRSIDIAKKMGKFGETGNENGNGNALARVCEIFITQNK